MEKEKKFFAAVCNLAVPAALQSMLQSSFSIVDQIMIGQLGAVSVAGVGLAGKFASIYSVAVAAIGTVAGIMLSQYMGQRNKSAVRRSFSVNLLMGAGLAALFTAVCMLLPRRIMAAYTEDAQTLREAAGYLRLVAASFLPMAGATMLSTLFRCAERARLPLYASFLSAAANTGLNYLLIFGGLGLPAMGVTGAALATVLSQWINFLMMLAMALGLPSLLARPEMGAPGFRMNWRQYRAMLLPVLACEVVWSLGENVYASIYGHMGTDASAAMTLINPIQGLVIGALCGLAQAASVLVGKRLGSGDYEAAYTASRKLLVYGAVGSAVLSVAVVLTSRFYVQIYRVDAGVKALTCQILTAYALVAPFKVLNMILGGGVLRSGGRTKYVMYIDMIGTWCFGVPLGLLAAFVFRLSIPYVYFLLSLEECVRFGISVAIFRRKSWMQRLEDGQNRE